MRSLSRRCSAPFAIVCLALACAWSVSGRAADQQESRDEPVALKGLDPVLLTEGKETKGKPEFAAASDGFRYLFASAANKEKFEKDLKR